MVKYVQIYKVSYEKGLIVYIFRKGMCEVESGV